MREIVILARTLDILLPVGIANVVIDYHSFRMTLVTSSGQHSPSFVVGAFTNEHVPFYLRVCPQFNRIHIETNTAYCVYMDTFGDRYPDPVNSMTTCFATDGDCPCQGCLSDRLHVT